MGLEGRFGIQRVLAHGHSYPEVAPLAHRPDFSCAEQSGQCAPARYRAVFNFPALVVLIVHAW
jgi:hypothetical protein